MPDLSLVPTDQLIDEVLNRHDAAVIITLFVRTDAERAFTAFTGGRYTALGLILSAQYKLTHEPPEFPEGHVREDFEL